MLKKMLISIVAGVAVGVTLKIIDKALATKYSNMDIKDGEAVEKQEEDPQIVKRIKEYAGKLAEQIVLHEKEINAILSVGRSVLAVIISLFILRNSIKGNGKFQEEVLKQLKEIKDYAFGRGARATFDYLDHEADLRGEVFLADGKHDTEYVYMTADKYNELKGVAA